MNAFYFTLTPRDPSLGGGWRLHCFCDGVEVRSESFPCHRSRDDGADLAYLDAFESGSDWLAAQLYFSSASPSLVPESLRPELERVQAGPARRRTAACEERRQAGPYPTKKPGEQSPPLNKMGVTTGRHLGDDYSLLTAGGGR